ncbi:helix-turn-helix domain-containing protein [Desulforamulus aquiferis]|uniref:Helix-turn-helix domain-containing protein n=1 Tax=Desulforamulus aquiferis TaxID=1397668 RepID=A0AAW7ZAI8_9FIRM|nr:helix-turn-helix domain-containing protein [Desulforamulus aquiferis]MDO7786104.1 helix-turn-helix domain-containing protein [Desulforamulus aquiferis]
MFIHCNHIWDEDGLTFYAKGIYCLLAKFADKEGRCWPSLKTLKEHSSISKPTIIKAITELKSRGYVQIDKRKTVNGDFDHNVYVLPGINRVVNHVDRVVKEVDNVVNDINQGSKGDLLGVVNHVDSNYIHKNYSIELLGESKVLDNLIELYRQHNPEAVKRFKVGGITKARDTFLEAIRKGVTPNLLAEAITEKPEIPPWEIVKATNKPTNYDENKDYMDDFIARCQANGFYTD